MKILEAKPGLVLIKPITELEDGPIILVKDSRDYRRGIIQCIGQVLPSEVEFIEGDLVFYRKPRLRTDLGDYVDIDSLLCKE